MSRAISIRRPTPSASRRRGRLIVTRGEGIRVFDDAGKAYIDAMAGLWCASLGFNNERLAAAASAAICGARLLSHLLQPHPRAGNRRLPRSSLELTGMERRQSLFRDLGLGSERDDGEARLGLSHGPRQADQAQGHRARSRLPRLDDRRRLDVRSRLSCTANSACRCRASCTRCAPIPIAACSPAKTRRSSSSGWPPSSRN